MKRLPLAASFLLFVLLCVSIAYWGMQLFKPPQRPVAAPPRVEADIRPQAAASLFGGSRGNLPVASNYQLKGVVMSGTPGESQAILSANGKPAQAVQAGKELSPGVVVKEVHRNFVLLSENGVIKRVELPENAKEQVDMAILSPVQRAPEVHQGPAVPGGGGSQAYGGAQPAPQQGQAAGQAAAPQTPANNAANAPGMHPAPGASAGAPPTVVSRPPAAPR